MRRIEGERVKKEVSRRKAKTVGREQRIVEERKQKKEISKEQKWRAGCTCSLISAC